MELCTIVGAGEGLGLALAQRFGQAGARIALIGRKQAQVDELAARLGTPAVRATGYEADVSNAGVLEATFERLHKELGPTSILIYNASVFTQALPSQLKASQFVDDLKVNVVGALVAAQCVIPGMKTAKRGTILITGGGSALEPFPMGTALGAGKAALRNLAGALAGELEPLGIHVATVTIAGAMAVGTKFDPATIAGEFWRLHEQPNGQWQREVIYK
jgi:short-subunit dehydrogenase